MSFDQPTWVSFVAIPCGVTTLGAVICWRIGRRAKGSSADAPGSTGRLRSAVLASAWALAATLSVFAADTVTWWSEDAWPKVVWPMLGSAMLVAPHWNSSLRDSPSLWVIFGWIAVVAASLAMPVGETWADMQTLHRPWMTAMVIATTANALALHRMAQRGADRWLPLVIIAALAGPALMGAASYSALFHACLGAIMATVVIAIGAAIGHLSASSAIVFPSLLFMASMVAAGRFYSYMDVPPAAYGLALFAPCLISLADRSVETRPAKIRILVSAVTAVLIVGTTAYQFLLS